MYAQGTRGHDILAIFLVSIAHASSHFYHLVIPSLFPWILPHFGMNFLQGGILMTTFFVTSAVGQSMSGFLVDKVGGRTSMYTGLVLLIGSAVALGMAENVPMLYLSAMLAGAGNSVFHPSDYSLMNYNIQDRFLGHAFAWHNITGNIGWAICPFFMVTTAGWFGWRGAAFAASSVALIVLVIELVFRGVFSRDSVRDTTPPTPERERRGDFRISASAGCMVLLHVFLLYVWGLRRSSKLFSDDFQECLSLESDWGFGGTDCIPVRRRGGCFDRRLFNEPA